MAVFSAFRAALGSLGRNPILFVVAGLYGLLQVPQVLAQAVDPLLSGLVSMAMLPVMILIVPFFFAGIIAMATEAIDGQTGIDTLIERGKRHYVSVLGAYLLLFAVNFVLAFVGIAVIIGGGVVAMGAGTPDPGTLAALGIAVLVLGLIYLVLTFFVQFFGHAIVLDAQSAVGGYRRSIHLVRTNLLPAAGYTLVIIVLGGTVGLVGAVLSMLATAGVSTSGGSEFGPGTGVEPGSGMAAGTGAPAVLPDVGVAGAVAAMVAYLVLTGLFGGFFATFSTAFYREIRPEEATE